jgi:hypothetical protein
MRRLRPDLDEERSGLGAADRFWLLDAAWAIQGLSTRVPWRSDCLVRVLAAQDMLRRKGLRGTIHFQAGTNPAGVFEGHTWLTCGEIEVSGGPNPNLALLDRGANGSQRQAS